MPRGDSGDSCSVAALPDGGEDSGPAPAEMEMVVKLPARAILGLSVALQHFVCEPSMWKAGQVVSLAVSSQPCSCLTALGNYPGWCHDCRSPMFKAPKGLGLAVCPSAHASNLRQRCLTDACLAQHTSIQAACSLPPPFIKTGQTS